MSRPLNRDCNHPQLGEVDEEAGEFWVGNPFTLVNQGENLSAYERNRLFVNVDGDSFVDASFASAANLDSDSRSAIAADFNNDGAIDLLVGSVGGGPLRLFLNQMPQNNRLQLTLEGDVSNRSGIGARVVARIGDEQFVRDVFAANGFMGQAPPKVDLGVGDAEQIDALEIRWPSGTTQTLRNVKVEDPLHVAERDAGAAKHVAHPSDP